MTTLSFSGDAFDTLIEAADAVLPGKVVLITGHGPLVPPHDALIAGVHQDGVSYRTWDDDDDDAEAAASARPVQTRPWDSIADLYVY